MIKFPGMDQENPPHGSTKALGGRRKMNAALTLADGGGDAEELLKNKRKTSEAPSLVF